MTTLAPIASYRDLTVDQWWDDSDLHAFVVYGHHPHRVALAATNRTARQDWGARSLGRDNAGHTAHAPASVTHVYLLAEACTDTACPDYDCGEEHHFPTVHDQPLPNSQAATLIRITDGHQPRCCPVCDGTGGDHQIGCQQPTEGAS